MKLISANLNFDYTSLSLGSDPPTPHPRHSHSNNFFVPLGTEKRNKSPQADQKPGNSNVLYKFNNNSYTDFRTT